MDGLRVNWLLGDVGLMRLRHAARNGMHRRRLSRQDRRQDQSGRTRGQGTNQSHQSSCAIVPPARAVRSVGSRRGGFPMPISVRLVQASPMDQSEMVDPPTCNGLLAPAVSMLVNKNAFVAHKFWAVRWHYHWNISS